MKCVFFFLFPADKDIARLLLRPERGRGKSVERRVSELMTALLSCKVSIFFLFHSVSVFLVIVSVLVVTVSLQVSVFEIISHDAHTLSTFRCCAFSSSIDK